MFFISKDKSILLPLGIIFKSLAILIHTGEMGNQTIAMQIGKGTKTYQNLMSCVFIPVLMEKKKKNSKIEAVSNGLYKCKFKGSHSVSKGHS